MLRFQTSVALWDRSSVSAGSVTVSLYQLQCLVEVWVFPKLCFFFFYFYFFNILFYYIIIFLFVFWVGLGVFCLVVFLFFFLNFCSRRHHHHHLHDHQNKLWQQPGWMDGWIDWWMDGWETDGMLLSLELYVSSSPGRRFYFYFSQSIRKKDCYDYLTVCPSHFTPHLSSCEYRAPLGSLSSLFYSLSLCVSSCYLSAYQCCLPCAPCRRVVLYSTEGQRLGDELTLVTAFL